MELPAETIKTRDAAEAVYSLFRAIEPAGGAQDLDEWVKELEGNCPDLAAMLFTVARDQ